MADDISTIIVRVKSEGIAPTTKELNALTKAAVKTEAAVKKLGTQVVSSNQQMAGSAGATVALTNAILLLNAQISGLTQNQLRNTQGTRANTTAMNDARAAARGLSGSLGALWLTYGNLIPMIAGAAIGMGFKAVLNQGSEVALMLKQIEVKGEVAASEMGNVRKAVFDIGKGIHGPLEVATALETLTMAGLKAEDAVKALTPALNLATVGGTTIEKAAYSLVQVGTAMGFTADSYGMISDMIAKTASVSMSSVDSLSEAFKSASSVGVIYGVTLKDLGTSLAALSNLGIQGSAAGTSVKNFYKELDSEAKKVTGSLKKLGVEASDLKVDGKFRSLNEIMAILSTAMDKAGDKGGKFMQAITNERGMRTAASLLQLYRAEVGETGNAMEDLGKQIESSAGFTAIGAARLAVESKNQITSTMNTLKTVVAGTFDAMAPSITVVTHRLKEIFNSEEFKSGLQSAVQMMSELITKLVEMIPVLVEVGKAMLIWKTGMVAMAAARGAVVGVTALSGALAGLQAIMAGTAATGAMVAGVLGPLAAVLGIAAAAWYIYGTNKAQALDKSVVEGAISTNAELIESLKKEADRLEIVNKNLAALSDTQRAAAQTTRELAMAELNARNSKAEGDAKSQFERIYTTIDNSNPLKKKIVEFAKSGKEFTGLAGGAEKAVEAWRNWDRAVQNTAASTREFGKQLSRVETLSRKEFELTEAAQKKAQATSTARARAIALAAGNPDFDSSSSDGDKGAKAHIKRVDSEAASLDRLTAGYKARTEAIEASGVAGERVMARTQEMLVLENAKRTGHYKAGEEADMLERARAADRAKFEQQNANAVTEQQNKITEILNQRFASQTLMNDKDYAAMGVTEQKTYAVLKYSHATEEVTKREMERARVADEFLRISAAQEKLKSSGASAELRAGTNMEDADAMLQYGRRAKATAVEVANLEIQKLKLDKTTSGILVNQRLEKAGMEDLSIAYKDLAKLSADLALQESVDAFASVDGVLGAETAKVMAYQQATQDILQSGVERAKAGLEEVEKGGDAEKIAAATATFKKVEKLSKEYGARVQKAMAIDLKVANLKDIGNVFKTLGASAAKMGESFERVGTALGGVGEAFSTLAEAQAAQGISEEERTQRQVGAYGDMAGAAAGFFDEGSKGYKTMMGISKAFHAAEMAMAIVRMGQKAIEAVLNQANGDSYTAFARMAAMAAIVASLGFAVGGGFNSGKGGATAEEVQKTQGTGTVFGDTSAKSDSIRRSIELLKSNSDIMLPVNQAMLQSLQNIESAMGGLTNLVLRTPGVTDGTNMGIQTGTLSSYRLADVFKDTGLSSSLGSLLDKMMSSVPLVGGFLSSVTNKLASWFGSTKQKIVDSGLQFGGSIGSMQAGGGFNQYASVDTTKKSWLGLKKKTSNKIETQGLGDELSSQFGLIFTNLEETLKAAAGTLGSSSGQVAKAIDSMVIATTSISLKDLTGDALEDAINGVISAAMDSISERVFPGLDDFRRVGEGYTETVVRVASGIEQATYALSNLGITAISYTAIANKQGDVAVEMAKQSIAAAEGLNGVNTIIQSVSGTVGELIETYSALLAIRKQMNGVGLNGGGLDINVLRGAGGVSQLKSALEGYQEKYFTEQEKAGIMLKSLTGDFAKLGLALPANKQALRDLIEQTGVGTEANATLTGQLLSMTDAYAALVEQSNTASEASISTLNSTIDGLKSFAAALKDFKNSLLLGDLSTLTPTEKYLEAKKQYDSTVAAALNGDETAQANVTGMSQTYLDAARTVFASSAEYTSVFGSVLSDIAKLEEYTGTQLTAAEKELALAQAQLDSLNALNATALNIKDSLITLAGNPVIGNTTVDNSGMEAELAALRAELAEANALNAKQMQDLMAVVYDAGEKTGDTVSEAVTNASSIDEWRSTRTDILTQER